MPKAKTDDNWYFGMKDHIEPDAEAGLTHSTVTTLANVDDLTRAHVRLHGQETAVFIDAGCKGDATRPDNQDCPAPLHVAMKPAQRKVQPRGRHGQLHEVVEHTNATFGRPSSARCASSSDSSAIAGRARVACSKDRVPDHAAWTGNLASGATST